ncbi:MAG: HAMP domain-containing histidine kinase [Erysipelotrichales bacterium]|nr:MAG: HAMP domain-containing histidine kinase [Erysipelotrichales bacterium]
MSSKMSKPKKQNKARKFGDMRSLSLRMNFAMTRQNIELIVLTQILLFCLLITYQTVRIEQNAADLLKSDLIVNQIGDSEYQILGYSFIKVEGAILQNNFSFLSDYLPLHAAQRTFYLPKTIQNQQANLFDGEYQVMLAKSNLQILIRYPLKETFIQLIQILGVLFSIQMLFLLIRIVSNFGMINEALSPLAQLTSSAVKLQNELSNVSIIKRNPDIEGFAGALNQLDVTQLDQPIVIENNQKELNELTSAINDLLLRMNQAYKSQTRFVSDASHELRTPIAIIQGYINMLDRWGKQDEQTTQEAINAIKEESEHMKNLIEQLLFLARGDSDTMLLQKEAFNVNTLIQGMIKEAQLIDASHEYLFKTDQETGMRGDKQLIKQVIRILLDNSSKYSNQGEIIKIKVSHTENDVSIMVQDNGIGMKQETIQHIFDRFYRGEAERDVKTKGTGLGLSIAKWIVEKHEGKFEITSRYGIGTFITVTFNDAYVPVDQTKA